MASKNLPPTSATIGKRLAKDDGKLTSGYGAEEKAKQYKKTIKKLKTENRILRGQIIGYEEKLTAAERIEMARKRENEVLQLEKIILEKLNIVFEEKNRKIEAQMNIIATVVAENGDLSGTRPAQFSFSTENNSENAYQSAARLFENALNWAEKERNALMNNYEIEREEWKKEQGRMENEMAEKFEAEQENSRRLEKLLDSAKEDHILYQEEYIRMKEENAQLWSKTAAGICKACNENIVDNVLQCGHVVCNLCLPRLSDCHRCHKKIGPSSIKKIFLS